eukprot:g2046.t1
MQQVIPHMQATGQGCIILTGATASVRGQVRSEGVGSIRVSRTQSTGHLRDTHHHRLRCRSAVATKNSPSRTQTQTQTVPPRE